jgi:hypothetical protein
MDGLFSYGVGVGPAIVLVVLVVIGLIHDIHKKRRLRRYDEKDDGLSEWLA